ncbi:MAG: chemotaxis protein CheB [Chlamydiota bacterium]
MYSQKVKVLIVDDSKVSRDLMGYIIELDGHIQVIGYAENGIEALNFIKRQRPDVIITDIEMPEMNGFQLTRHIMDSDPIPIIVISGVYNQAEVAVGFEAIEAGALAIIEKPKGLGDSQCMDTARFVTETIKIMSQVALNKKNPHQLEASKSRSSGVTLESSITSDIQVDAIGIGASIGGPKAIRTLLSQLPNKFTVPIFVVQHITSGFIDGFVNWLNDSTTFHVKIAENGERAEPQKVYICPDKMVMRVDARKRIQLIPIDESEEKLSSISQLFDSMHNVYGKNCVGVLLTGVGNDGAQELLKLKKSGAFTIVQDDQTSVNFELPKYAIDLGAAEKVLPLQTIAVTLEQLVFRK